MKPPLFQTHNVLGANSANGQSIADERAMTAPRQRFGAHQCDPVLLRELNQFFDLFPEFRRLHVISVASKRCIPPTGVDRIRFGVTQATQSGHVNVAQAGFFNESGNDSLLNRGLCRERGIVRTSTTNVTTCALTSAINSSSGRLECPIV